MRMKVFVFLLAIVLSVAVMPIYAEDSGCDVFSPLLTQYESSATPYVAAPIDAKCLIVFDGYDKRYIETDAPATIKNGRTLVPMRFFLEALGSKIWWVPAEKKIVAVIPMGEEFHWDNITKIEMWIGKSSALVNGSYYEMPSGVAPQIMLGRTYVPLRFVGEVSGWYAQWDSDARVAIIHR